MGRKSNHDQQHDTEYHFFKAAWEGIQEVEKDHNVRVKIELVPTQQRGIFFVGVEAYSVVAKEGGRRLAGMQGSYPNSRSKTMGAYLFGLANSLGQMVEAVRADELKGTQAKF